MMFCMVSLQRKKLSLFIVHQSPMNLLPILGQESKSKNEIKGSKLNSQSLTIHFILFMLWYVQVVLKNTKWIQKDCKQNKKTKITDSIRIN